MSDNPSSSRLRLVCASTNPGKVAEIETILDGVVELLPRPADIPDVVEDADTLLGNARLKARAICEATGMPAIADDTGLEVDALGGEPGVHTGRYAGEGCSDADNRHKLLSELDGIDDRRARFRTCMVVAFPDGSERVGDGVCEGEITRAEQGGRGFGYDSVFAPVSADGATFAEMSKDAKNAISHRGAALRNLLTALSP